MSLLSVRLLSLYFVFATDLHVIVVISDHFNNWIIILMSLLKWLTLDEICTLLIICVCVLQAHLIRSSPAFWAPRLTQTSPSTAPSTRSLSSLWTSQRQTMTSGHHLRIPQRKPSSHQRSKIGHTTSQRRSHRWETFTIINAAPKQSGVNKVLSQKAISYC